jgi:4-amino-4-deoxy-L-arabinose transferase-like glycosyltransferase
MVKTKVTDFLVYRYRYIVGYIVLGIVVIGLLLVAGLLSPNGISEQEQLSVVTSNAITPGEALSLSPQQLINAPYHALQKLSIHLFGVTTFSIKLPSLLLGGLAIVALHGLLRLWFRRNVALITSIIAASSGLFLFLAQQGTPDIGYFFWNISLLLAASRLTQSKDFGSFWLILASGLAALSLYSPLQAYIVAGLALTCAIHPHARFVTFRRPAWALIASGFTFILLVIPLIISVIHDSSVIQTLLGVQAQMPVFSFGYFTELAKQYTGFWLPEAGAPIYPVFSSGIIAAALVGLYRLLSAKYTAKSYILSIWIVLSIIAVLLVPNIASFTLLPTILLLAFAFDYLIRSWYRLFPRNPYARVAGLIPLAILMLGLSVPSVQRFVYGYHYSDVASQTFTKDLALLSTQRNVVVVVPSEQLAFYTTYAYHSDKNIIVVDKVSKAKKLASSKDNRHRDIILHRSIAKNTSAIPAAIITNNSHKNADRFYRYTHTDI